jgi:hypothetical protein
VADVFNAEKRSDIMRQVKSKKNKSTVDVINPDNKVITAHNIGCIIWIYQIFKGAMNTTGNKR